MARIETGVDKLVELIQSRKKIALEQAAKELGVSPLLVQEWADFLEEEKVIGLEYSLSRVFLVERKLSKKEVEHKSHEFDAKRDAFVRKVETAVTSLDKETQGFERLKEQFLKFKQEIGSELTAVKDELRQLEHYENLKKNIEADVSKQRDEYAKMFSGEQKEIKEAEARYEELASTVQREMSKAQKARENMNHLHEDEKSVKAQIDDMQGILKALETRLVDEKKLIDTADSRVNSLHNMAKGIEEDLAKRKEKMMAPLIKSVEKNRDKVLAIQDELLDAIHKRSKHMQKYADESHRISETFTGIFSKREQTETIFEDVFREKLALEQDLQELLDKAKAFNLMASSAETQRHIHELEQKYLDIHQRKGNLLKNLHKIVEMLQTKESSAK